MTRPNILCLVSEDCPPRLGSYGDKLARTPNLDRLAAEGVSWDAAMCTSPVCAPSRFAILTGRYGESVPPAQQMTAWGDLPEGITTYPQMMRAAGYYCTNNSKTHYNVDLADPTALWDECSGQAHWKNRAEGQPFLAVFNCMFTHESCVFEPKPGAVSPEDVTLPGHLPDLPELRQDLASYYNRIADMDAWMGARLAELEAAGLMEDTIILYHSDHASPLARSKRFCYDDGLRVPLIARVPEKWRHLLPDAPGARIATPVSLVDLPQTLAAVAGIEAPEGMQGVPFMGPERPARTYAASSRDRMDSRYDLTRTLRSERFRYIRNYAPHRPWGQYYSYAWLAEGYRAYEAAFLAGQLTEVQARFWQPKPVEELYDMAADPDALVNLATDPAHTATLAEMSAAMDAHMLAIHDCGLIPERSPAEVLPERNDPAVYPLPRVLELANLAIRRDPANLPRFLTALTDPSAVIRYWAAQGLLILAAAGQRLPHAVMLATEAEEDADVLVALWEAIGHSHDAATAALHLTALADKSNPRHIRIKALAALTALPPYPAISRATVAEAAEEDSQDVIGAAGYLLHLLDGSYTPQTRIFNYDKFLKHMEGHSGIGPQSFPDPDTLRPRRIA
ncbi:sulfatase [Pararhodobacter sp. CCB-MM2]|uniref:sulfatase family protein n=1 Tax=Pararhodobacter sp. CCB-MM2 TaxID=1786003 RepID=UPI000837210E|nr:sulfatase [Pararhodobacter sp. CCB-MM2]